jgi:hypothetical protein
MASPGLRLAFAPAVFCPVVVIVLAPSVAVVTTRASFRTTNSWIKCVIGPIFYRLGLH